MVNRDIVSRKLRYMRDCLDILRRCRSFTLERFVSDPFIYSTAERNLQLAIECAIDIGAHIIADEELGEADEYNQIFLLLGEHNILPDSLTASLVKAAKFRNMLVHIYETVNKKQVYDIVQRDLDDLEKFAQIVAARYLA